MSSATIAGRLRRLAPLAQRVEHAGEIAHRWAEDVAAEVGVEPAGVEAEAARLGDAAAAAGATTAAETRRFVADAIGITEAELEREAQRLAGRARGDAWSG